MSDMVHISKNELQSLLEQAVNKALQSYFQGHTVEHVSKKDIAIQVDYPQADLQTRKTSIQNKPNGNPAAKSSMIANKSSDSQSLSETSDIRTQSISTLDRTEDEKSADNKTDATTTSDIQHQITNQQKKLANTIKQIYSIGHNLSDKITLLKAKNSLSEQTLQTLNILTLKLWAPKNDFEKAEYQERYLKLKLAQERINQAVINNSKTDSVILNKQQAVIKEANSLFQSMQQDLKTVTNLIEKHVEK